MASEDLVSLVTTALEARGTLGKLRAQLRASVFSAIYEQNGGPFPESDAAARKLRADDAGALALSLVQELMNHSGFDYSLAVMQPEAGVPDAAVDRSAVAAQCGLDASGDEPLLVTLLRQKLNVKPAAAAPAAGAKAKSPGGGGSPAKPATKPRAAGGGSHLGGLPPLGGVGSGRAPLPSVGGGAPPARGRGVGSPGSPGSEYDEERRLDAIEQRLAPIAGLPVGGADRSPALRGLAAPAIAVRGGGTSPRSPGAPNPLSPARSQLSDELVVEESIEEYDDDFAESLSPTSSAGARGAGASMPSAHHLAVDESLSPGRLDAALKGFDHAESVELPRGPLK